MATNLTFDGNSLQTANIITQQISHENIPEKDAKLYALAHSSKSVIPFVSYPSKSITISGQIYNATVSGLDNQLDTFRGYFTGTDKNLDIDYSGSTRRYIATVNKLAIDRPGGLSYADFQVEFVCTQPFGQNTTATTILNATGRTASSSTDNYTFIGSSPVQRPIFTVTLTALTGGTNANVVIGNSATGQQITINRTWSVNDVLVVDTSARTVQVNGVDVAFTGAFPIFAPGAQTITYSDSLTTRTLNFNIVYSVLYL